MARYYVTTTLPYVNAEPHIGFAMEIVRADVMARTERLVGNEVWFNTGTDEHGQKIFQKAVERGIDPQVYCDEYAEKFALLKDKLNLSYDSFVRTTDESHIASAQEFWKRCLANGDIYKKNYQVKYCVGCELEKTDSDLVDGHCPDHPSQTLELRDEENYFFRFSRYQDQLLELYRVNPEIIQPDFRRREMINFVEGGLSDFSISRLTSKMPWGVPVPDDSSQVMYVWFDALVNYISVLGWPDAKYAEYWPGIQVCGKDNLRQQTAMWQAMLFSAGVANSKQVFVNGFILSDGQKMSKSVGNVIDPIEWIDRYGVEAVRYFILAALSPFEDSDVTEERFRGVYQADLANGIGNLVARVAAMAEKNGGDFGVSAGAMRSEIVEVVRKYRFDEALASVMKLVREADGLINENEVWKLAGDDQKKILDELVAMIRQIGWDLEPFMPETASKIQRQFAGDRLAKSDHLFARLDI
jgi:methionyl-tRNA synthetase